MDTHATRSATLALSLDFRTKTAAKKAIKAYSAEIWAGMERNGMTLQSVGDAAKVSMFTVWKHRWGQVSNPQVRTMFSILFALGWEEITVRNPGYTHSIRKAA